MLSLLDIKQIVVAVNKMDIVNYSQEVFENIKCEYSKFLKEINIDPVAFIPITAREGVNLTKRSSLTPWYKGKTVVELIDEFICVQDDKLKPFRMFVQDVYKFTANGDDRRIIAGTVNSGSIKVGDEVVFLPSCKKSRIKSIEVFNGPPQNAVGPGVATGFTLETQVYVKPTELMCKVGEKEPYSSESFRASIVWLGKQPLVTGKYYKIKIGTQKAGVVVEKIESVLDASALESFKDRNSVQRHEVAQCILTASNKISFDPINEIKDTGRLVIIDGFEIAGGGIIIENIITNIHRQKSLHINAFESELHELVRRYFPHRELKDLVNMENIYNENI
jgi:sulfate adenylyltransferase subunit 1 (EFTu-like GTPase family)